MTEQFVFILDGELSASKKGPVLVTGQGTLKLNCNPFLSIWEAACLSASGKKMINRVRQQDC